MEIRVNSYSEQLDAMKISSEMWNYLRSLKIDGQRTLVQVVKEQLQAKYVSQGCKGTVNIRCIRSAYVSWIEALTGVHDTSDNEVKLPGTNAR